MDRVPARRPAGWRCGLREARAVPAALAVGEASVGAGERLDHGRGRADDLRLGSMDLLVIMVRTVSARADRGRAGAERGGARWFAALGVAAVLAADSGSARASAAASDPLRTEQYAVDQSRFPGAWSTTTGRDVVVAVVDTGVDTSHPDLVGRLAPGVDLVDGGDPDDGNGHGTHVAGIVAATADNGVGIAGAAPAARIMPVRVLDPAGSGSPTVIAEGIDQAVANGADVVNLSLGGSGLSARLLKGGEINRAIRAASDRGVVVVAAAGNDGNALRSYRFGVPVLVVNAVDEDGGLAEFSNYADARAVSAGGVDIVSTVPREPTTLFPDGTDGYAELSGTSMAAPLVAAEAALLLAQGRSAASTIETITATAQPSTDA
ncbi:MAG: S8 family serine peptidase, partial [Phycicoccus sp.]